MPQPVTAETLGRLLAEHGPTLALLAAQWTRAADDCVQEALIELAALPTAPENPAAWVYKRVRLRALNASRAARRRRENESVAWRERLLPASESTDPGETYDLLEALEQLTPADRELVTLRFYSGLTFAEIAEVFDESSSTIHRRCEKALDQLRQRLEVPCRKSPKN